MAGPLGPEEGILYADLDLELGVRMKLRHDFAGHYNRPDVFQLRVNACAPRIFEVDSGDARLRSANRARASSSYSTTARRRARCWAVTARSSREL